MLHGGQKGVLLNYTFGAKDPLINSLIVMSGLTSVDKPLNPLRCCCILKCRTVATMRQTEALASSHFLVILFLNKV